MTARLSVLAVDSVPEVSSGDDLAAIVLSAVPDLADGDVLVVTSKIVSKAEGRVREGDRARVIDDETVRVVARRGPTSIARTRHGLTLAAAGVDASNVEPGTVVLLPEAPDESARGLRSALAERAGRNVAVVLSDTAGRPWREGQTDIAVGCAGLVPLDDHAGREDPQGNLLSVTAPAVADEVAAAADLVMGKVAGRPLAVVRGLQRYVLAPGQDGAGASALIRAEATDMFALGAVEAAWAVLLQDDEGAWTALTASARGAATPSPAQLAERVAECCGVRLSAGEVGGDIKVSGADDLLTAGALERLRALALLHGCSVVHDGRREGRAVLVLRPAPPTP